MKTAVVVHVFYPELWPELAACIRNITGPKAVYVTYSDEAAVVEARADFPEATFVRCENRGYDVWPFLKVVQDLDLGDFDCIVKLHTKRDIDQDLVMNHAWFADSAWRDYLLAFLKSPRTWRKALARLRRPGVGMVSERHVIFDRGITGPRFEDTFDAARREIGSIMGQDPGANARYVAGTMFAVCPAALRPLLRRRYTAEMFEAYSGHERETYAHVMERMLGLAVSAAGLTVEAFNGSVSWRLGYYRQTPAMKLMRFFFQCRFSALGLDWRYEVRVCRIPVVVRKCVRIDKLLKSMEVNAPRSVSPQVNGNP